MVTAMAGGSGRGSGGLGIGGDGAAVALAEEQRSAVARDAAAAAAVDTCGGGLEGDEGRPVVLLADSPCCFCLLFRASWWSVEVKLADGAPRSQGITGEQSKVVPFFVGIHGGSTGTGSAVFSYF